MTEGGQRIYGYARKNIFEAREPKMDKKLKSECEELAVHIKTFEQFESLYQYVQSKFDAPYHLKNMINELNSWMQIEKARQSADTDIFGNKPRYEMEVTPEEVMELAETAKSVVEAIETTDKHLIDKMSDICHSYQDDNSLESCLGEISSIRHEYSLDNTNLLDHMTEAYRWTLRARTCDAQAFFDELYRRVAREYQQAV